ncbi:hypothetical protein OFC47_26535, partial [Escherichia coli]|nr:hypothetical protein [Escherichia coli]
IVATALVMVLESRDYDLIIIILDWPSGFMEKVAPIRIPMRRHHRINLGWSTDWPKLLSALGENPNPMYMLIDSATYGSVVGTYTVF